MKKNLLKILTLSFVLTAFAFIAHSTPVLAQATSTDSQVILDSQPVYQTTSFGTGVTQNRFGDYGYRFNGERGFDRDMMSQFMPMFAGGFAAGFAGIVLFVLAIIAIVFWVKMFIHAIKNDVKYKPVWILVLWFMHIIGAIVYYFAIKKKYAENNSVECVCKGGVCVCGPKHTEQDN